jgi:hypothetical protein
MGARRAHVEILHDLAAKATARPVDEAAPHQVLAHLRRQQAFSVRLMSGAAAWPSRSSGAATSPSARRAFGPRCPRPARRSAPHRRPLRNSPDSASSNSSCPLPATPAMPSTSPAARSATRPSAPCRRGWARRPTGPAPPAPPAPGPWPRPRGRGQHRADHQFGHLARRAVARGAGGHHLAPPQDRRLVAQRADLLQLVADVQDRRALGRSCRRVWNRMSTSCGVSTLVGSSMISSFGSCSRQRTISTRCRSPADRSPTIRPGSSGRPYSVETARIGRPARASAAGSPCPAPRFRPRQRLEQAEMLEHHRHARARASPGLGGRIGRPAQRIRPASGLTRP